MKKKHGRRYEENLKKFALYLFLKGGKSTFECLAANFEGSFPSLPTIKKLLSTVDTMLESELQIEYLFKYMSERHHTMTVWIAEDQTKVVEQVVYDKSSNRLLGFVTKLAQNGFPEKNSFLATSAQAIKTHFDNGIRAPYVNVIMAQPLNANASAFCVAAYGSNNRFTSTDVQNRWEYLESECLKSGITTLGFSSDGDPRCLKSMKDISQLGSQLDSDQPWYKVSIFFFLFINNIKIFLYIFR